MDYEVCKKNAIEALRKVLEFRQKSIARVYNELSVPVRHDGRCTMYSAVWCYLGISGIKPEEDIKLDSPEAVKVKQKVYSDFEKINGKSIDSYKDKYGFHGAGSAFPHTEEQAKFAFALWSVMANKLGDEGNINNENKFGQWLATCDAAMALESYTGKKILAAYELFSFLIDDEEIKNADGILYLKEYSGISESGMSICGYTQPIKKENISLAAKILNEVTPFNALTNILYHDFVGSIAGGNSPSNPADRKKILELLTKNPELQKIINAILKNNENQSDDLKKLAQEFCCVFTKYCYFCIGKLVKIWLQSLIKAVASRKDCNSSVYVPNNLLKKMPEDRRDETEKCINDFIKTLKNNLEPDDNKIDQDAENELRKRLENILEFKPETTFMKTMELLEEFSKFFLSKFVVADTEKLKIIESEISKRLAFFNERGWLSDEEMQEAISKVKKICVEKEAQDNNQGEHEQSEKSTDEESDHDEKGGQENDEDIHGQSGNNINQESNQEPKNVETKIDEKDNGKEQKNEIQTPAVTPTKKDNNKKNIKSSKFKSILWWMKNIFLILTILGAYWGIRNIVNHCKEENTKEPNSNVDANKNESNDCSKESIMNQSSNLKNRAKEANETNIIDSANKKKKGIKAK